MRRVGPRKLYGRRDTHGLYGFRCRATPIGASAVIAAVDSSQAALTGASDAWSGRTNQIVVRIASAWEYYVPKVGWLAYIEDEAKLSADKTTGWSAGIAI